MKARVEVNAILLIHVHTFYQDAKKLQQSEREAKNLLNDLQSVFIIHRVGTQRLSNLCPKRAHSSKTNIKPDIGIFDTSKNKYLMKSKRKIMTGRASSIAVVVVGGGGCMVLLY